MYLYAETNAKLKPNWFESFVNTGSPDHSVDLPKKWEVAPWIFVLIGILSLYLPTYFNAWNGIWQSEDMGHGPLILAILLWLFWTRWKIIIDAERRPRIVYGYFLLSLGLTLYFFGRVFNISSIEFSSHIFVLASILCLLRGSNALIAAWFPLVYLIFLCPIPGSFVDLITQPLKHWISVIVVEVLIAAGYPIGRAGVVITIGPYQLLVADACSGLHSMFSLAALGTLYMYLVSNKSRLHNLVMLLSIIPISFMANIFRVVVLVLVTYHLGDEAGQGFLHGFAGIFLMMAALLFFMLLDSFLNFMRVRWYSAAQ